MLVTLSSPVDYEVSTYYTLIVEVILLSLVRSQSRCQLTKILVYVMCQLTEILVYVMCQLIEILVYVMCQLIEIKYQTLYVSSYES